MAITTIEGYQPLSTGRIGLVPPNIAAHVYQPIAPSGLIPALIEDHLENFPLFATNGVALAPDAGVWVYQPNIPAGMIEVIPSLQSPTNTVPPLLTYVTGGGGAGNIGSIYQCNTGTWTPAAPTPTYTRQWLRDGNPISGSTGVSYAIATADIGHIVNCAVVATNPAGSSNPFPASNPVGPIPTPSGEMRTEPQKHGKTHHARSVHR